MPDPTASTSAPATTGTWRDRVTSKGLSGPTNTAVVLVADIPEFLASIDKDAPAGKGLKQLQAGFDQQKNLVLTITYLP